ncbi:MAG: hypothetical protein V4585_18715 [Bacteroidota bacterium]
MTKVTQELPTIKKNRYQSILLRGLFVFVAITTIPFFPKPYFQDYSDSFQTGSHPWRILDVISQNSPWFFNNTGGKNYVGWLITVIISILAGFIWQLLDRKRNDDSLLTYWFYVIVRYGLALRMSWFAIAKVLPVQMPFPTISQLNTNLGEFTPGKLYWLTTGVSPVFEVFAGIFELLATIFILFRKTTTLGALMMVAILVPIWFVNIGYDAGVELTSLHILTLALIILAKDARHFWTILIEHKHSIIPIIEAPNFTKKWQQTIRITFKSAFILIFLVYRGFEYSRVYVAEKTFKLPLTDGVKSFVGFYNVAEYRLNNQLIPYAPTDILRWQNVVFEKFNTFSIKVASETKLNTDNKVRTTEYYGNIGRLYYAYEVDTLKQTFILRNRADTTKKIVLNYSRPNNQTFILSGINEKKDSLYVVLNKIDKKYPLLEKKVSLFAKYE